MVSAKNRNYCAVDYQMKILIGISGLRIIIS